MSNKLPDTLLREVRDFPAKTRANTKRSHTQRWGQKLHEQRLNKQNGEIVDAIVEEARQQREEARQQRARSFVEQLNRQERRIIKEQIAEKARAAEKNDRRLNPLDENGDITE